MLTGETGQPLSSSKILHCDASLQEVIFGQVVNYIFVTKLFVMQTFSTRFNCVISYGVLNKA
jgi:hypothetical protein